MRNHGSSPSAKPHSYEAMANDIAHFIENQGLSGTGINLMGHSMGGKAVMAYALNDELNKPLRTLVSVDMSPAKGKVSPA
jgi:pimeloyl-ACP methyl ester carboxylesterase